MESYEGLFNRNNDHLRLELKSSNRGCPNNEITYYDRNDLKVEDRSLSPFEDFIDFNPIR